jgi:hypothetical protein
MFGTFKTTVRDLQAIIDTPFDDNFLDIDGRLERPQRWAPDTLLRRWVNHRSKNYEMEAMLACSGGSETTQEIKTSSSASASLPVPKRSPNYR